MTQRLVWPCLAVLCVWICTHDLSLIAGRVGRGDLEPVRGWQIAFALLGQSAALATLAWAAFLIFRRRSWARQRIASTFVLLPLVVPVVVLIAATTLLEIGLYCSNQSISTKARSGHVCPAR